MKYFLLLIAFILIFLSIRADKQQKQYQEYQMIAVSDIDNMSCRSEALGFTIKLEVDNIPNAAGQWDPNTNTITVAPNSKDVDTISHEVYHMTTTMIKRYDLNDQELGAWMQGSFTECVYQLIENK